MGDLTPGQKRFRVFSNRYLAANIGYSVGPVIGAYIGIGGKTGTFLLAGAVYLSYAVLLTILLNKYRFQSNDAPYEKVTVNHVYNVLRKDVGLLFFLIGGILLTTVHGQMSVTHEITTPPPRTLSCPGSSLVFGKGKWAENACAARCAVRWKMIKKAKNNRLRPSGFATIIVTNRI
jgi:hypothetical protein